MDHINKQILLLGIGEEFYMLLATVMTDHGKTGSNIIHSVIVQNLSETPAHLVGFSRRGSKTAATATLRCHPLSPSRYKVLVGHDVPFDGAETALKSELTESGHAHRRIGDVRTLPHTKNFTLILEQYKQHNYHISS